MSFPGSLTRDCSPKSEPFFRGQSLVNLIFGLAALKLEGSFEGKIDLY